MHALFRDYMLAHMAGVIGKFNATSAMQHPGEKGTAREALAASVVRPWFGPSVEIGTGIVIDRHGKESHQSDNVLYWPDVQPATYLGGEGGPRLFPVEGVAAVVEVKSTLTTENLGEAIKNLKSSCRALDIGAGAIMDENGYRPPHRITFPFACILAFDSKVATDTLTNTLKAEGRDWNVVCVLGEKGGLYMNLATGDPVGFRFLEDATRLLTFSVLLRDNVQNIRASRGTPGLAHYVAEIEPQQRYPRL